MPRKIEKIGSPNKIKKGKTKKMKHCDKSRIMKKKMLIQRRESKRK